MADLSTAAQSAIDALAASTSGGFVEEYEIGLGKQRIKRGSPVDQVDAALKLEALSHRRTNGLFRLARFREDG
jgi:hypothetical protein